MRVRVGAGKITEPKDKPGLATFVSNTFSGGGLEAHSEDDLKRIFAGKSVGIGNVGGRRCPHFQRKNQLGGPREANSS